MSEYHDYRFRFRDLVRALQALTALRGVGLLGADGLPENMLGTSRDRAGEWTSDPEQEAFRGERGRAASSGVDDDGNAWDTPAQGDPGYWYVHIRSKVAPDEIDFDPAEYGLEPASPDECAAVLGVWS